YFKASRADNGTKVDVIRNNAHKYSVSAMCDVLQIPKSTYYYKVKERENNDDIITNFIIQIFKDSRNIYGQRKIKRELYKLSHQISSRRIGRIMKEQGLVSKYTVAQFRVEKSSVNESDVGNLLNREFHSQEPLKVIVSDLTYVRVQQKWHYIYVLVDLYNRVLIGYSAGAYK